MGHLFSLLSACVAMGAGLHMAINATATMQLIGIIFTCVGFGLVAVFAGLVIKNGLG